MPFRLTGPHGGPLIRRATLARAARALPGLVRRFRKVTVTEAPRYLTPRDQVVRWALWGAQHEPEIHYTEGPARDGWLAAVPRNKLPLFTDCSGFATLCYYLAGAADPNGLAYKELGYTGTMLAHAQAHGKIRSDPAGARPGDLIVIGPGTGDHVVVCVKAGRDPLVVSHGDEAGPVEQRLSVDSRTPKRVCVTLP